MTRRAHESVRDAAKPAYACALPDLHNVIHNFMRALRESLENGLNRHWYRPSWPVGDMALATLLRPLEWLYRSAWQLRERRTRGRARSPDGNITLIAIGNLVAGGAGKTPATLALASALQARGVACGIVCRPYRAPGFAGGVRILQRANLAEIPASEVGDEAWLLSWRSGLPVGVGRNRLETARALAQSVPELRALLIDDGLQQRDLLCGQRLLVIDDRGFGNRHCLPAGPLREPIGDLRRFTGWIANGIGADHPALRTAGSLPAMGGTMTQSSAGWVNLARWEQAHQDLESTASLASRLTGKSVLAAAGIAVPARFFELLAEMGLCFSTLALQDHDPRAVDHIIARRDHGHFDAVLMTEKDAVKFFHLPVAERQNMWALRREAHLPEGFVTELLHGFKTS